MHRRARRGDRDADRIAQCPHLPRRSLHPPRGRAPLRARAGPARYLKHRSSVTITGPPNTSMSKGSDSARRRTITVFLTQGLAGLLLMLWVTWLRIDQTAAILHRLQPNAAGVILILIAFATTLALLKFELTELIFVSLVLTAYTVIIPILGVVMSSWLAVIVAGFARVAALKQIGPA